MAGVGDVPTLTSRKVFRHAGHEHELVEVTGTARTCDVCQKDVTLSAKSYKCLACDFDFCVACFAPEPSVPRRAGPSAGRARGPEKRGMAKMFHPSNGRELFGLLSGAVAGAAVPVINVTPAVAATIVAHVRALMTARELPRCDAVMVAAADFETTPKVVMSLLESID